MGRPWFSDPSTRAPAEGRDLLTNCWPVRRRDYELRPTAGVCGVAAVLEDDVRGVAAVLEAGVREPDAVRPESEVLLVVVKRLARAEEEVWPAAA
jgi:hypothetical protein